MQAVEVEKEESRCTSRHGSERQHAVPRSACRGGIDCEALQAAYSMTQKGKKGEMCVRFQCTFLRKSLSINTFTHCRPDAQLSNEVV